MSVDKFWNVVAAARQAADDPTDAEEVAEHILDLLTALPAEEIAELAQPMWELLAQSYSRLLWDAAHLINGGCSDDGFEYFRGWLLTQGRETFERVVAEPDLLALLPGVQRLASGDSASLECESMYNVVGEAYENVAPGQPLPQAQGRYPALDPALDFDEVRRRLPRLAAMFSQ